MAQQSRARGFSPFALVALNATALLVAPAAGQCPLQQLPGPSLSGTSDTIFATCEWDPDGTGPRAPVIVAGGTFVAAGSVIANCIAAYDPATASWSAFGMGMDGDVRALAVLPGGDLVAAGSFTTAGGTPANRIARWDGTSWSPLAVGMSGPVRVLTVLSNGDLVAGGSFATAGGATVNNVVRWNGLAWTAFGSGVNDAVYALTTLSNGDIVAGGDFTTAGGSPATRIARWNGASWSAVGTGTTDKVRSLVTRPNGNLVAGLLTTSSYVPPIVPKPVVVEWNGTTWATLLTVPPMYPSQVSSIRNLPNGDIAIAGLGVQTWNGSSWSPLGSVLANALTVLANGTLAAGGTFASIGGVDAENLAFWNGTVWIATAPVPGPSGPSARMMLPLSGGDLLLAASFGENSTRIGVWNGNTFSQFGTFVYGTVVSLALHPSGDVLVAGTFLDASGTPANRVARWNGIAWSPLGSGITGGIGVVLAVTTLPNGDIVVGGEFNVAGGAPAVGVARWNGTTWSQVGSGLTGVRTVLALPNGDLLAGCDLPATSGVMRFDGTSWSPLGTLPVGVVTLALLPNGDVVAGGDFNAPPMNGIARWNGTSWLPLGPGAGAIAADSVYGMAVLPDGDVIAIGMFSTGGGVPAADVARWNGSVWSPLVATVSPSAVTAVGIPQQGGIVLGGRFGVVNGQVSARFAWLDPTCPAGATASGTGCTGSGGVNVLAAQSLPWCGATFRAIATGLPASSLALGAYGANTTAIALPVILPQGAAGCSLLVVPDALELLLPASGAAQSQLTIPNTVSLAGIVLHEQILALDLGPTGSIVSVTSTNRLSLTIGTF